ncbi:histidine--tRNA ligase [soil metagenome]
MKLQAVTGTKDILPERQAQWREVTRVAERVLGRAGAQLLCPPIFEYTDVFTKSVGETSDLVVQHEMYTFSDQGGRSLTLRPEFTAGVVRAFIEHGMHLKPAPVKLWSYGPAFRAERPQRGRFRQLHQVNYEALGLESALVDAEAIGLLYRIFGELGLRTLVVKLGSVGDPEDRLAYNRYLRERLSARRGELSEASRARLALNPMRILDSKDGGDQAVLAGLERPLAFLNPEARAHFEDVQRYLRAWEIPFEIDDAIVRGLDYYRRTAFEVHHGSIGAQSALCGGGRYDGLVEAMGGPATPGIGWAFGVERLLDALAQDGVTAPEASLPLLYLVPMDRLAVDEVAGLAQRLRRDFTVLHGYSARKPGKGLADADRAGAVFAGLRGERERDKAVYSLKQLASGQQHEVAEAELATFLASALQEEPVLT